MSGAFFCGACSRVLSLGGCHHCSFSSYFCSFPSQLFPLPGPDLAPTPHTGCAISQLKTLFNWQHFRNDPPPQSPGHYHHFRTDSRLSAGKVIVFSTIKFMKCRLKYEVRNVKRRTDRHMETLNTYLSRDSTCANIG